MTSMAEYAFWLCALGIIATYLLYPLSLVVLGFFRPRHAWEPSECPTVTLIISAYNEEAVIREKLENALALDYPKDALAIFVISDGSTDRTDEIVRAFADRGVTLFRQEPQRGKSSGLTRFVPEATSAVLVFSDANSMYDRQALRYLVAPFRDPNVGYVVGHQRYVEQADELDVSTAERLYWQFEILIKKLESRLGSVVGGDGAIYAIRAFLFQPLRDDDLSDFVNPLQIIARGHRGVFEPRAFCTEEAAPTFEGEFRRKVRIVNRAVRGLARVPVVLNPFAVGWFAYQIFFHKVLRWFVPYLLIGALIASALLAWSGAGTIYSVLFWLQIALYSIAAASAIPVLGGIKPVYIAYYFCLVNLAALLGTLGALRGRQYVTWRPERS